MSEKPSEELEVIEQPAPPPITLFGSSDPGMVMEQATKVARVLANAVKQQKLFVQIKSRQHVKIEGWTLLGSMVGVYPATAWTKPIADEDGQLLGWEARVEAVMRDGSVVGAAEAECRFEESNWQDRDSYAVKSMAQTRAASKALRMPLGFIMQLAGFDPTPADEMPRTDSQGKPVSALTPRTLTLLNETVELVRGVPLWEPGNILRNASAKWGRRIDMPEQLREEEALAIVDGIEKWLEAQQAKMVSEEPSPAPSDFEPLPAQEELERLQEQHAEDAPK